MTRLSEAVEAIFESSRPDFEARVATLEAAVSVVLAGDLGEGMRAEAERDAHKLAGTLGSFGRRRASLLARELEVLFASEDPPADVDGPHLLGVVGALRDEVHARPR